MSARELGPHLSARCGWGRRYDAFFPARLHNVNDVNVIAREQRLAKLVHSLRAGKAKMAQSNTSEYGTDTTDTTDTTDMTSKLTDTTKNMGFLAVLNGK